MGQAIRDFFTNYWIISAIGAWFTAQIIKIFTGVFRQRKFSIRAMLFGTGGMPSSHTASVCALCTAFAVKDGFASPCFAISALLCIVVITDAVGVRRETGKQSQALNTLLGRVFTEKDKTQLPDHFRELIGHTPLQVACGAILGVAVALLFHLIPVYHG